MVENCSTNAKLFALLLEMKTLAMLKEGMLSNNKIVEIAAKFIATLFKAANVLLISVSQSYLVKKFRFLNSGIE